MIRRSGFGDWGIRRLGTGNWETGRLGTNTDGFCSQYPNIPISRPQSPNILISIFVAICIIFVFVSTAIAAEKNWAAAGDGSTWSDDDNWSPAAAPTTADDVLIDTEGAAVTCAETFKAKSVIVGGRETSSLTSNNFIFGTVAPDSSSDVSMMTRSGGTITLKGAGTVTVQGQYKDSEETLVPEPSFMFWIK